MKIDEKEPEGCSDAHVWPVKAVQTMGCPPGCTVATLLTQNNASRTAARVISRSHDGIAMPARWATVMTPWANATGCAWSLTSCYISPITQSCNRSYGLEYFVTSLALRLNWQSRARVRIRMDAFLLHYLAKLACDVLLSAAP